MSAIGKAGRKVTVERHGESFWQGIAKAKGWHGPRAKQLRLDLAVGAILASSSSS